MSKNREIEAKVALNQESYEQIAAAYPVKADFQQKTPTLTRQMNS